MDTTRNRARIVNVSRNIHAPHRSTNGFSHSYNNCLVTKRLQYGIMDKKKCHIRNT